MPASRDRLKALLLVTLVAAAFRLPGLGFPPDEVFDEVYHAKTALQYLHGESPVEWVHPPTAKLLIAAFVWLFGYNATAWRLAPALAGTLLAPVFLIFARRVLATERAALLATVLLLTDGVYLVQSRIAMTNIFAVLFQVTTALFILKAAALDPLPIGSMVGVGCFLGLALSTRWTSLFAAAFLGLTLLAYRGRRIFRPREILLCLLAFVVLPAGIYTASYVPWMRQGHTLTEMITTQKAIYGYHAGLVAEHPYFSKWYTWPWLYRPTWYYFDQQGGKIFGIVALGNPVLWWASVPVTIWALATGIRARDPRRLFCGFGFCLLYLPWGISPRTLNYGHYLFEAIPYACLSLGLLLDREWDGPEASLARSYVVTAIVLFFFFLPLLMALPLPAAWFNASFFRGIRPWTWFPTWI